jgi:hypothetical protein
LKTKSKNDAKQEILNSYRVGIVNDLINKATRLIACIDEYVLPHTALHGTIFFLKIQADFYRYMADAVLSGETK